MRYEIESYKLIGVEHFRIIDTFNGGNVIAKGFQTDAQAITRRDELNQFQQTREKPAKLDDMKHAISADSLSKRDGVYTARWGFFYTHGQTSEQKEQRVKTAFPQAEIVDAGRVDKAFSGRATLANSSHFFVKFTLATQEAK